MNDSPVGCHEPMFAFGKRRLLARPQTGQILPSQPYKTGFTQSKAGFSFAWEEGKEIQPMVELAAKAHPTGLCYLLTGKRKVKQSKSTGG